jgi:N-succinyl-L-ornithine transcarbamylase
MNNSYQNLLQTNTNGFAHFTSVADVVNIEALVQQALQFKANPLISNQLGKAKRIGLLFLNPSLRTRLSTQIAAENLGIAPIVFNVTAEGWNWEFADGAIMNGTTVEHIKDAAPILGSYFDILALRTFPTLKNKEEDYAELVLNQFIKYVNKPVVSLESATLHPLQSLADIITITEHLKQIPHKPKIVLTWAPHIKPTPQCVSNSFAQWINAWKIEKNNAFDFIITQPKGFELDEKYTDGAQISYNQKEAIKDADFLYVKNWSSYKNYGQIAEKKENWLLTNTDIAPHTKVMHCLPVRRNIELSDSILDSAQSIVTQQAGNRVWSAQAVLAQILQQKY